MAEAHKRLTAPLTTMSYAMVGLLSALGGMFRRHGGMLRPLVTVGVMVLLLALGLAFGALAARDNSLIFLMWLQAIAAGRRSAPGCCSAPSIRPCRPATAGHRT